MPPIHLLIKPASSLCNMRCRYCFYADVSEHRQTRSYGIMSRETLETLTRRALAEAEGECGFTFQGGEPTLAGLDFYRELIRLQKQYNTRGLTVRNAIQTNGLAVDDAWASFFAENRFLVGLSVDGYGEVHDAMRVDAEGKGTFSRVMKTAALLERRRVDFNILCVVNNYVARRPRRVYETLKRFGYLQFIPCLDPLDGDPAPYLLDAERYGAFLKTLFDLWYADLRAGRYVSVRQFDNYVQMLRGRPPESCGISGVCACSFVVEGDGSVYPCDFYVLDRCRLGSVETSSFAELRSTETAESFVRESRYVDPACASCRWLKLCRGGCRRCREPFADGKPRLNRFCAAYRAFFDYAFPRLAEIARNY